MSAGLAPNAFPVPTVAPGARPGTQAKNRYGESYTYGPTTSGEMTYIPDQPVNRPAPYMHQDPNTGDTYQWDPREGRFTQFSTGQAGDARALGNTANRMAQFQNFWGSFGSGGSAAPPAQVPRVDSTSASDLAFARAKDRVGASTQGLLKALGDRMGSRGLIGSSIEGNETGNILQGGGTDLANVASTQATSDVARAERENALSYQGGITQRGQDLQAEQARRELALRMWSALNY